MKLLILGFALSVCTAATPALALPAQNPLSEIKSIECKHSTGAKDFWTLTPNVFSKAGKSYLIATGYKIASFTTEAGEVKSGREEKPVFFYEIKVETAKDGSYLIRLINNEYQFIVDREVSLTTKNFVTGEFMKVAFQPGTGGYGPGGIPQGTTVDQIYNCEFLK